MELERLSVYQWSRAALLTVILSFAMHQSVETAGSHIDTIFGDFSAAIIASPDFPDETQAALESAENTRNERNDHLLAVAGFMALYGAIRFGLSRHEAKLKEFYLQ